MNEALDGGWTADPQLSLLEFQFGGPHLRTMQNTQNPYSVCHDHISRNIRRTVDHEFPGSGNAPQPAAFGEFEKATYTPSDLFVNMNRSTRIFSFNLAEDGIAIFKRELRPNQLYSPRASALRRAAARRSRNRASASSSSTSGRVSSSASRTLSRNQAS